MSKREAIENNFKWKFLSDKLCQFRAKCVAGNERQRQSLDVDVENVERKFIFDEWCGAAGWLLPFCNF